MTDIKKSFYQIIGIYLLISFIFLPLFVFGQIDVRHYTSEDLFSAKPVITKDPSIRKKEDVKISSFFENEIKKGTDLWSQGEYEDAIDHFETMIDQNPEESTLYYYVGLINFETSHFDAATSYFIETLKKNPLFLEAKYMLGLISIESKDLKTAKGYFDQLSDIPLYKAYGLHGNGLIYLQQGNAYKASRNFKDCIESDSTFLEAYIPLIQLEIYFGKLKSAKKVVEKGLRADDKWQEGILIRGILSLLENENIDQFQEDISRLIELDPNNYHYYSMKGFLQIELKEYHEAVGLFRTAYNLDVDSARTGEFKFNSKFSKEEGIQRSLNYYFEHYGMEPNARKFLDIAICKLISGEKKEALTLFDEANSVEETAVSHTFKGAIFKSMYGKEKDAIKAFSSAIDLDSTHWVAYSYRGEEYLKDNNLEAAYLDFDRVVRLRPKIKEGYKNRGAILLQHGYFQQAYKDFSFGIALDITDYDLYFNRAVAAIGLEKYTAAEYDLKYILKNKPEDGEAYYMLYRCRLSQQDTANAIIHLDSASRFSKHNEIFHEQLLKLAISQSLDDQCISAHNRLVKYNPWNYEYLFNRAKFLYLIGRHEEALKDLNKYVKNKKSSGKGFYYLGKVALELGYDKESEKSFKKARKLGYSFSD